MSQDNSRTVTIKPPKISKADAIKELWIRGELSWKLKSNQKELYNLFYNTDNKTQTWLLSRRSGKTFCLSLLAIEACIRNPNTIIKFVAPTKLQISTILRPIFKTILSDCPDELQPEFKSKDYIYYFPNGSEIQLAGSEAGHAEKLRGGSSHIAIIDEAQDVTDLDNIIKSILLPTTLTTKGKVILAGTPPKDTTHDFISYIEQAEFKGSLVKKTVYDNPMITPEDIELMKAELGGENSDEFRREMLCHLIKDSNYSAIPEFTQELKTKIVMEWPKPPFYDTYESMDLGFKDLTVILFAYFDFKANKIIIEDEIVLSGKELKIPSLVDSIRKKETELWTNPLTNEIIKPSVRVSDINYIVTGEISRASNGEIGFLPAKKDDKQAAVNQLRVLLQSEKIIINPKCRTLIRHLENVRWDKSRNTAIFTRSAADESHFDAVDACLYLIRHINFTKNPYPIGAHIGTNDMFGNSASRPNNIQQINTYKKIFGIRRK